MRVLFIVHGFPPRAMGGTEIYAHDLARTLMRRHNAEVFVLTREVDQARPEYATRRETTGGLDTLWINNSFRLATSLEESYRNRAIRKIGASFVDEIRPDVAHVHHLTCLSTDLVVELASRGVPIVFTLHDFWMICHRGQLLDLDYKICRGPYPAGCERCVGSGASADARVIRTLRNRLPEGLSRRLERMIRGRQMLKASAKRLRHMRQTCGMVDQFLSPSRTMHEHFLAFGIEEGRIARHEYGIDVARFRQLRRTDGDRLRIGFLGSLMISKGAHVLLEACSALLPERASLYVFGEPVGYHGDDSYRRQIEPLLAGPGIHRMGPIAHERVPEALASIDVIVAPSIWLENSPLVIREAFAAGIPVVTSNIGGMAELVTHGVNGLLFTVGSVEALRAQLLRLVNEPALLPALRSGIRPIRTVEDDADTTYRIYESQVERSRSDKGRRRAI
jgi:glycosyltransferase involved in cell wall biosynthesis